MTALRKLDPWGPPLALMAVIFFFSAQPNLNSGLGWIDHVGRKFIHAGEYALLCFLWWRALRTVMSQQAAPFAAFAIAVAYSATDEYHQGFVAGRHSTWVDVLIDSMGAAICVLLIHRARPRESRAMSTMSSSLTRPPIESMRPVVSFAAIRLLLPVAALIGDVILGFPQGSSLVIVLAAVAIPWATFVFVLARRNPSGALTPWIAAGDMAVLATVEFVVPATWAAVHFIGLVFIGAHAHFQGPRRGILIAVLGASALIGVSIARPGPVEGNQLAFYETVYAVAAIAIAAVIGELRGIETAGRLRARELSRRTIVGEDEVRRHVADFIHDGPVQELIGLDLMLQGAVRAAERGDTPRSTELIRQARQLAESNVHALRDEIVNLGPYAFEELSFEIAVERCIPVWKRRYSCEVTVDGNVELLEPQVANDLFRITQEAVANGCKHGEADHTHVSLTSNGGAVELRIIDNGKGFGDVDPLDTQEPGHIGLASMRERAELLNAELHVESRPGRTEVRVRVPVGGTRRRNRR